MAQQGPPHAPPPPRPGRPRWPDEYAEDDEEYPPWAGPAVTPRWAEQAARDGRRPREGGSPTAQDVAGPPDAGPPEAPSPRGQARRRVLGARGRLAAARARRARRARLIWGGAVAAVVLIAAGVGYQYLHQPAPVTLPGSLVTTFQPGEFHTVPNACTAVTAATLGQYLPGVRKVVIPRSMFGSAQSLCDWTLDARPAYRVLEVTVRAYPPSGLASGNGSATSAAVDAYHQAAQLRANPPRSTHMPRAVMTRISGLGNTAFAALQVPSAGGSTTNVLTVVARNRNVVITVIAEGLARPGHGYAAAPAAQLQAAAVAAARDVLAGLH